MSAAEIRAKELYSLKLGEEYKFKMWNVWRVPGGWIFAVDMQAQGGISQFVPFSNEFQKVDKPNED